MSIDSRDPFAAHTHEAALPKISRASWFPGRRAVRVGAIGGIVSALPATHACRPLLDRVLQPAMAEQALQSSIVAGMALVALGLVLAPLTGLVLGGLAGGVGALGVRSAPAEPDALEDVAALRQPWHRPPSHLC